MSALSNMLEKSNLVSKRQSNSYSPNRTVSNTVAQQRRMPYGNNKGHTDTYIEQREMYGIVPCPIILTNPFMALDVSIRKPGVTEIPRDAAKRWDPQHGKDQLTLELKRPGIKNETLLRIFDLPEEASFNPYLRYIMEQPVTLEKLEQDCFAMFRERYINFFLLSDLCNDLPSIKVDYDYEVEWKRQRQVIVSQFKVFTGREQQWILQLLGMSGHFVVIKDRFSKLAGAQGQPAHIRAEARLRKKHMWASFGFGYSNGKVFKLHVPRQVTGMNGNNNQNYYGLGNQMNISNDNNNNPNNNRFGTVSNNQIKTKLEQVKIEYFMDHDESWEEAFKAQNMWSSRVDYGKRLHKHKQQQSRKNEETKENDEDFSLETLHKLLKLGVDTSDLIKKKVIKMNQMQSQNLDLQPFKTLNGIEMKPADIEMRTIRKNSNNNDNSNNNLVTSNNQISNTMQNTDIHCDRQTYDDYMLSQMASKDETIRKDEDSVMETIEPPILRNEESKQSFFQETEKNDAVEANLLSGLINVINSDNTLQPAPTGMTLERSQPIVTPITAAGGPAQVRNGRQVYDKLDGSDKERLKQIFEKMGKSLEECGIDEAALSKLDQQQGVGTEQKNQDQSGSNLMETSDSYV